ncbi:MAG: carboxypeptidase-like regulatory domain-containing protein [Planctomycetota bacterium]
MIRIPGPRIFILTFFAACALPLAGCIKSGTDVGPQLPQIEEESSSGIVMDTNGNPVSNAYVTVGTELTFTDQRGRFRFRERPNAPQVVRIDARLSSANAGPGGIFDILTIFGNFQSKLGVFDRPFMIPNFAGGASANISVNLGQPLAGTLVDPATGAELILTGAVATLADATNNQTTIRFISIPAESVTQALEVGGVARAGILYFAISPANLNFTTSPVVRIGDTTFGVAAAIADGKVITPELDRIGALDGKWGLAGAAQVAGGFVTSSAVDSGGIFSLSIQSPIGNQTIVTARIVDQELEPLQNAVALARDGRASLTDSDGLLAIPGVVAADANGVPINVSLTMMPPAFRAQPTSRIDILPGQPGAGLTTDFNDRPLPTVPSGRARVLPIFEGEKQIGARVGLASAIGGLFDDAQFATIQGTEFWDVPLGIFNTIAVDDHNSDYSLRAVGRAKIKLAGSTADLNVFLRKTRVQSKAHKGSVREVSVRSMSLTPVFNTYHQLGLDGAAIQNGFSSGGFARFGRVLPGLAYTTSAQEIDAPGLGIGGIDIFRKRAFHTHFSEAAFRRAPFAATLNRMLFGYDRAGSIFGNVTQLTNPGAVAPVNGAYAVELRPFRTRGFEDVLSIAMTAQSDFAVALPPDGKRPSFNNSAFEALVPVGLASLAIVERDAADANSNIGNITRFGGVSAVKTYFARRDEQDVVLDIPVNHLFSTTIAGPSLPSSISLVYETTEGFGAPLGDQSAFTINGADLDITIPSPAANRVGIVGFASGATANGSTFETYAAIVSNEAGSMSFLTIPVIAAPAPPMGEQIIISPQTTGITWAGDAFANETILTMTRVNTAPDSTGKNVKTESEWSARVPGSVSTFIFPKTPAISKNFPVPVFFESGAVYTLTIESRRYLNYDERSAATSPDSARPSYFNVRALARTRVDVKVQ